MKMEECVSFIVLGNGGFLLEKRHVHKDSDAGKLAIPGGRMEQGESQMDTLYREMQEELNLTPDTNWHLCSLQHFSERHFLIHYYVVPTWRGELLISEAESVHWAPLEVHTDTLLRMPPEQHPVLKPELDADKVAIMEYQRIKHWAR